MSRSHMWLIQKWQAHVGDIGCAAIGVREDFGDARHRPDPKGLSARLYLRAKEPRKRSGRGSFLPAPQLMRFTTATRVYSRVMMSFMFD